MVAGRDVVSLADGGAAGTGDRLALVRRPPPSPGRLLLRRARRFVLAGLPRRARRAAPRPTRSSRRRPGSCSGAASSIANTLYHSAGGGGTENNENVYVSSTGAKVAGAVSYLRGSMDRDPTGKRLRRRLPVRHLGDQDIHPGTAVRLVRGGSAGPASASLTAIDLRNRGVSGRLISVTLIGSAGTKKVSARRLPVGLQRAAAERRPDAPLHALRDRADPLTARYRGPVTEPRPRCAWAGADGPNPDPVMVAYHDDEWGDAGPRRRRAVRAAGARVVPGRPVVVDDPAQEAGFPGRLRGL